jgi:hypothetical protein
MGDKKDKGGHGKAVGIGILLTLSCIGVLYLAVPEFRALFNPEDEGNVAPTPGVFSVVVKTPMTPTVTQSPIDFDCTLHQHRAGYSYTSTSSFVDSTIVDDVSDLNAAVFAAARLAGYDGFWVTVDGAVANNVYTFNDGYGPRTYGARDFQVDEDGANVFNMYATPNAGAGFTIRNSNTGAAITTANITAGLNFTVTQFLNNVSAGAFDQAYVAYTNYIGHVVDANVLMTFANATGGVAAAMEIGDLVASNLSVTGGGGSAVLDFHASYLGQSSITTPFIWGDDAVAAAAARITSPSTTGIVQRWDTAAI